MVFKYACLDLVKFVWTTFIKGSYAYQLLRKTSLLKQEIKNEKSKKEMEIDFLHGK